MNKLRIGNILRLNITDNIDSILNEKVDDMIIAYIALYTWDEIINCNINQASFRGKYII